MKIRLLFDHDIEGFDVFLIAGLRETGWDQMKGLAARGLIRPVAVRLTFVLRMESPS